tara:strand:- start:332 stop:553 length:222 start_codon:yes stop_codon:yes gene_type:complete
MDFIGEHIDAQVEAYKANRHKESSSRGMRFIRRLFKKDDNKNHESISSATQKRPQGHRALEIQKASDSISKRD